MFKLAAKKLVHNRSKLFCASRFYNSFVGHNEKDIYKWNSYLCGIEAASTPPSSWYIKSNFLVEVEQKITFNKWLLVCDTSSLRSSGDYVAVTVNEQPIVVVNSNGVLNAFYNVCRHHAAQICDNGEGKLGPNGRFSCLYHGWQYNADGKLVKATHMKGCKDFSAKNFGLKSVRLDTMGPWVYINLSASSTNSLIEDCPDLAEMHSMLQNTGYEALVPVRRQSYTLNCNWKVFVDNYLDGGYHVPIAHPALSASLEFSAYTRKGYDNFYLQTCAAKKSTNSSGEVASTDSNNGRISGGQSSAEALYIFQYPNIMVNRYGQWMDTNIVWPLGVDKCVVDFVWYADKALLSDPQLVEESLKQSDQVQQEDVWLCERVQKGLQSNGYDVGRYAPTMEGGEYMFHRKLHEDFVASEMAY